LNALLETLFFLSRVEEKKYFLQKKDLRIKTYIQQKQSDFFEKFPEKNIDFHYDIHEELHYKVDLQTFSILLDNLL